MEKTITTTQVDVTCWCGIAFSVPVSLYDEVRRKCDVKDYSMHIYCPIGHMFSYGASSKVKELQDDLTRTRQRLDQEMARAFDLQSERDSYARKLKRVHKGTCPECKRSFTNLSRHMQSKHATKSA